MGQRPILLLIVLFFSQSLFAESHLASSIEAYYGGDSFLDLTDDELRDELFFILQSDHIANEDDYDTLTPCDLSQPNCYRHMDLGYKMARRNLFGRLHLEGGSSKGYRIRTFYCRDILTNKDFPKDRPLGELKIPAPNIVNAEHSWPQSFFNPMFSKSLQKSDLHTLFPVRSRVNTQRSNHPYGRVEESSAFVCDKASLGKESDQSLGKVFSPSDEIKGDIARALFYFAVRYKLSIDAKQEHYLRLWHWRDPVDKKEARRHEGVYRVQNNRNPFIDFPELVDEIDNF